MKKFLAIAATVAIVAMAGSAFAAGSTTVNVSATVTGSCSFSAATYAMNFPAISVTDTGVKDASAALSFTCTNNTTYSMNDVAGVRTLAGAASTLAYSIDAYTTTGIATGAPQTVTLTGHIAQAAYQAAAADTYNEALVINITP